jgi:hypothetical protein
LGNLKCLQKDPQTDRHTHTHIYTLNACPRRPGTCRQFAIPADTRITHSKCSNKNKHTRRHTSVQEDGGNVDSSNARLHIYWLLVDCWQFGIYWKQEAESGRMCYTDSLKLISLNKNVSYYWLNKHMFCGRCQATAIYDTVIWRITSEPGREFNMSQMCE